jgi:hypothetical protein
MNNFTSIAALVGVGILGGVVYNYEKIKIEFLKQKGIFQANRITIDFFINLLNDNPNITLNDAILKFEDIENKYSTLEEFAKNKNRTIKNYTEAYSRLFDIAKKIKL